MNAKKWNILKAGVGPWITPKFAKRIELSNFISLLFSVFIFGFAVIFYFYEIHYLSLLSLIWLALALGCIYLNHIRYYTLSRIGLMIGSDIFGFLVCWMLGKETDFHLAFFAGMCIPLIIFEPSEKLAMFVQVVLTVTCYLVLQWLPESLAYPNKIILNNTVPLRLTVDVVIITVNLLSIYYLRKLNEENEKNLEDVVEKLEVTNKILGQKSQRMRESHAKLIQSEKMAALGIMASGIAHEINNPLTIIYLNGEKIKKNIGDVESPVYQYGQTIVDISKRIAKITESLKKYSRDTSNDEAEYFKVSDVIHDTLSLCSEKFEKNGIKIIIKEESLDATIRGQLVPLSQTLLNLLNNSFDAIKNLEEKWVRIETVNEDKFINLAVTDSGNGIPQEVLEKIFQPFFTTKEAGKGTGLGLSISKDIVLSHGGKLKYDRTSPNTKFDIWLPVMELN
ncbi:MAG: sensor histidine kinase [Bdellovibrio sp.]